VILALPESELISYQGTSSGVPLPPFHQFVIAKERAAKALY
jgi:hypothetical protein